MAKLSDLLKSALEKKQGVHHSDNTQNPSTEVKSKAKPSVPSSKKPLARSAGRGR